MNESDNALRIEATVIGTLLQDSSRIGEVVAELSPSDFGQNMTRTLYAAICKLHFAGAPINRVTVEHELGDEWSEAVAEMLKYTTSDVVYYANMVKEENRLHSIRAAAMGVSSAANLSDAAKGIDLLNSLVMTRRSAEVVSSSDAAREFLSMPEKAEYLPWGFKELDEYVDCELGDFVVIGGYPSAGKTLLSIQFALEMAKRYRVGYFSLETSPKKLTNRIMSHLSAVPLTSIKHRERLNKNDWKELAAAAEKFNSLDLDMIDAGGMTVRDIQALTLNKQYQVVFVDYLQLLNARGANRYEQVTNISQALHTMARVNKVTVIALAQLARPDKSQGKPQPPTMSSFRESGQIEQDADIAFLLWPADPNDNSSDRVFKIGKNKEGERMKMDMLFDGKTQTLRPRPETKGEHYRKIRKQIKEASKSGAPSQVSFTELSDDEGGELPF